MYKIWKMQTGAVQKPKIAWTLPWQCVLQAWLQQHLPSHGLSCNVTLLLSHQEVESCISTPLNLRGLCGYFNQQNMVVLCQFCTKPFCGLAAHTSCLLEANHHVSSAATWRPAYREIYKAYGGFLEDERVYGDGVRPGSTETSDMRVKKPFWKWNLQPQSSQLMPRKSEMNWPARTVPKFLSKIKCF